MGRSASEHDAPWRPEFGSGFRRLGEAAAWGFAICAPMLAMTGWLTYRGAMEMRAAQQAAYEATQAWERLAEAPAGPSLPLEVAVKGREVFVTVCAACHGPDGQGGLGKDLTRSDLVARFDDHAFREFIIAGRPNAAVPMPPRAGRPDLTDADLDAVVTYVRGLQDPRRMPELPPLVLTTAPVTEAEKAAAMAAAGGDAELAEYIASGAKLYATTCIACHGPGGVGIKGNGKPLVHNEFVASLDDDALLAFIKRGRDPSDPKNTTGVGMPAKGGNPALSEDDLLDIIAYVRTLQRPAGQAAASK
ncbi:MAG: hypothetical protein HBSAPP03_05730 [Phycisphaerae bacterium]|nr:MAG: hypothetical protein HBSAPP03_05730 [Phycisphaerae bacterium]